MNQQDFILRDYIKEMKAMAGEEYQTTAMDWLEFACDLCENDPSQLEDELANLLRSLLFVQHNFEPEVLQASLNTLLLPGEVVYGAMLFNRSIDRETVQKLAETGALECGYVPRSRVEKGTLSLIQIEGPSPHLLMAANTGPERIKNLLRRAAVEEEQGTPAANFLTESPFWIYDLSQEPLCPAALEAFSSSTAVGRLYRYFPQTHGFTQTDNPLLEMEVAEEPEMTQ